MTVIEMSSVDKQDFLLEIVKLNGFVIENKVLV